MQLQVKVAHGLLVLCCPEIWRSDGPPRSVEGLGRRGEGKGGLICTPGVTKRIRPNLTRSWYAAGKSVRNSAEHCALECVSLNASTVVMQNSLNAPINNLSIMVTDHYVFVFRLWSRTTIPMPPCNTSLVWNNTRGFLGWLARSRSLADPGVDATAGANTQSFQDSRKTLRLLSGFWGNCTLTCWIGAMLKNEVSICLLLESDTTETQITLRFVSQKKSANIACSHL